MSVKSGGNINIDYNNIYTVSTLYFHDGAAPDAASIKLDHGTDDFTISHDLIVEGALTPDDKIDPVNIDQDGASDEEVLTWETDTSRWQPETGGGDASKEYATFYLSTGGVTGVGATEVTLVINETMITSDAGIFELASNQVTVNKTAVFLIRAHCGFDTASTNRSEYTFNIDKDGSPITAAISAIYTRGYSRGSSGFISIIYSVTSGDVFQLRIIQTAGAATGCYQEDYATRLTFIEL